MKTKEEIKNEIREAYPWLDEQHVEYYAQKCIETQSKKKEQYAKE